MTNSVIELSERATASCGDVMLESMRSAAYDDYVAQLLDEAVYHAEHFRLGASDRSTDAD